MNKHSQSPLLPEKSLLAKRLAQCLTSFLPSGVHLKALETYHLVFTRIGPSRLARDLPLYAGGLFPLLSHCSTSLKAPLLSLYEAHFLPLGTALSPVLDGFVLAILPGVEDESSEFYGRSQRLLDSIERAVLDSGIFARALWRALLLSPPMRLSASHYLRSNLSDGGVELREEMVSDMPLVAYAMTAALSDNDALTQRSVLDLLLGELSLNSLFFRCKGPDERDAAVALVGGVFGALLRRDMSLTKRVHAWLLGGLDHEDGIAFCNKHSSDLILAAIGNEIEQTLNAPASSAKLATRPCKIAAALTDRDELSECLGHHFALRILRYGMRAIANGEHEYEREIQASIADLLQDLGSARVFAELERMLAEGKEKTHTDFELLSFALSMLPTKNEIVRKQHLPELLRVAVHSLNAVSTDTLTLDKAVSFCSRAVRSMGLYLDSSHSEEVLSIIRSTVSSFASFFVAWLAHVVELAPVELRRSYDDVSVADEYSAELRMASVYEKRNECISLAKGACSFFVTVASSGIGRSDTLHAALQATAKCASTADVRISLAGAKAFAEVSAYGSDDVFSPPGNDEQALGVIRRCWRQLHPSLRTATPQSAQALLLLQRRFPEETKIVIADGILSTDLSRRLRNLERFACLWRLTVEHRLLPLPSDDSLFLMLDALSDDDWGPKMLARSWLSDALELDAASVIDAPLRLLLTLESRTARPSHEFTAVYDAPRALYGFQVLRGILESCPTVMGTIGDQAYLLSPSRQASRKDGKRGRTGVRALASSAPSARTAQGLAAVFSIGSGLEVEANSQLADFSSLEGPVPLNQLLPAHNYVLTIAIVCLGYLRGTIPDRYKCTRNVEVPGTPCYNTTNMGSSSSVHEDVDQEDLEWILAGLGSKSLDELHAGVCAAAAECLATLLTAIPVPSQMSAATSNLLAKPILTLVQRQIGTSDPVLDLHFLNAVSFLVTADGPCYLSSVQGKEVFTKLEEPGRMRLSYSESQMQLHGMKQLDEGSNSVQVAAVESLHIFLPWLLDGVSKTCRTGNAKHDSGSQEVLGVRRRWIQFIETVMRHIGLSLPIVTEGILLVFCILLKAHSNSAAEECLGDSEFSRVDETLILLEGLAVVASNVLWSFEHALSSGDLKDESPSSIVEVSSEGYARSRTSQGHGSHTISANGSESHSGSPGNGNIEAGVASTERTNVTAAMINAINPLRMINDFVKDVLSGSGSDGSHKFFDPRRSAARVLFSLLPEIVENCALVWGPSPGAHILDKRPGTQHASNSNNIPPRLSTELPRERRQAQRTSVLSVLEPIFQLRPTDVIASIIALFGRDQDDCGTMSENQTSVSSWKVASYMLHALDSATPAVIVSAVKSIIEKSMKWDRTSNEASEGRAQAVLRAKARVAVQKLLSSGLEELSDGDMKIVGRIAPGEASSSLAGGTNGLDLGLPAFSAANGPSAKHQDLFHWGDFFARHSSWAIETASLNFMVHFLATCNDGDDVQGTWPVLSAVLKDVLSSGRRKASIPAALSVLGSFVSKNPSPFPDRRYRREIMTLSGSAITACASIASGSVDLTGEDHANAKELKKQLSSVALRVLSETVPVLVDSVFLDDKPILTNTVMSCLSPAVSVLKRASARAASASGSSRKLRGLTGDSTLTSDTDVSDITGAKAATDVILNISRRDWGVKMARRELLVLLEDPNFFHGKGGGVLERVSLVVREVVASGGASYVLSSIGSSSSNGTPGIPSLFTGRDSEAVLRARTIRRIAFCVFVSEPDFYSPQLPSVLERIRDALRIGNASLVVECLLCLRALLLRTGPQSISAFRATTLSEMFRITSKPTEDLLATVAALQFLDLITLLSPPDYGFERCFFFGEQLTPITNGSKVEHFQPLAHNVTVLWTGSRRDLDEIFAPPFRLERGRTVLTGRAPRDLSAEFVGRYAMALVTRNSIPKMKATTVDKDSICRELELEFMM